MMLDTDAGRIEPIVVLAASWVAMTNERFVKLVDQTEPSHVQSDCQRAVQVAVSAARRRTRDGPVTDP